MGKTIINKQNDMNNKWINDYGEMRWVRKNLNRKLIETTIHQHTIIKQLETKHKGGNRRSIIVMNNRQLRTKWYS